MTWLTDRYTAAVDYAREAHATQVKKGTTIPYLSHLLGVSSLVIEYGGDEDQAIAGLLHDVIEDCGEAHEEGVRQRFGERVARIVLACTDGTAQSKADDARPDDPKLEWEARKRRYLAHLDHVDEDALLVSGCDKLHNLRAIGADLANPAVGSTVFSRFKGGREGTCWYYTELVEHYRRRRHPAIRELQQALEQLVASHVDSSRLSAK
jgi:(p)ppGpp synthase/HD superfamily hydrolase